MRYAAARSVPIMVEHDPAPAPAWPALRFTPEQRRAFALAQRQHNDGFYFECHETLEELWAELRGPWRGVLQGFIQAAVACYHLDNGNRTGALSLFGRALQRLEAAPARALGGDLEALRRDLRAWRAHLEAGGAGTTPPRPRWEFAPGEDEPAA